VSKSRGRDFLLKIYAMLNSLFLCVGLKPFCYTEGALLMVSFPAKVKHKRYLFVELMKGVTPESLQALNAAIVWALNGVAVGIELI